ENDADVAFHAGQEGVASAETLDRSARVLLDVRAFVVASLRVADFPQEIDPGARRDLVVTRRFGQVERLAKRALSELGIAEPAACEGAAGHGSGGRPLLAGLGEIRRLNVECFTAGMFKLLGVAPLVGRRFAADEDQPGGPSALVIGEEFWRRELDGRPDAGRR